MRQADYLAGRVERLGEVAMKVEARRNSGGQCATAGEEDVCNTAIGAGPRVSRRWLKGSRKADRYGCGRN
jgi:hypothetical protein